VTGVEFLDEGPADVPAPVLAPRRRRPWWLLGLLAVVVAAAGWVLARPTDAPKPDAHPTVSRVSTPGRPTGPIGTASPSDRAAIACHGAPFCSASLDIPSELRMVIRQYVPDVKTLQVRSYIGRVVTGGGRYLTDRDISILAGSVNVLISLHRNYAAVSAPSAIVTAAPGVGSVLVHAMTSAYTVDLQYLAPETVPPALRQLRRLCRDSRLEVL
jgi:hypothetical protein